MTDLAKASGMFQGSAKAFDRLPAAPQPLLKLDQTLDQLILTTKQVTDTFTAAVVINTPAMWTIAGAPIDDMTSQITTIEEELSIINK